MLTILYTLLMTFIKKGKASVFFFLNKLFRKPEFWIPFISVFGPLRIKHENMT